MDELKTDGKRTNSRELQDWRFWPPIPVLFVTIMVDRLGEILDEINCLEGFRVRFTGPWAPFSFVDYRELS